MTFLVTGATGNVGRELVRALAGEGRSVRALVRAPSSSVTNGVTAAVGDLDDPASLRNALVNVTAVFLLPGHRDMQGVIREMERAGVKRVVQLSGNSATLAGRDNAVARYMLSAEDAVRRSNLEWTIVRPSALMSNCLAWKPQLERGDVVRAVFGSFPVATVDPADIAAVAAVALTQTGHHEQIYKLTGPQSLYPRDQVAVLARVLDRNLRFEDQPEDEARAEMLAAMAPEYVDAIFDFHEPGSLDESNVVPTVFALTHRSARSFEDWARTHQDDFAC